MAAHAKYPTAHEQLFDLAVRARREGVPFDLFWLEAVRPGLPPVKIGDPNPPRRAIQWPRDTDDRNVARVATNEARGGWRRAYEREDPTGPERALIILSPILEAMTLAAVEVEEEEARGLATGAAVALPA